MTNPITKTGSSWRMNVTQFNTMLRAARALLAAYHAGTAFDPETVKWAHALTAANPTDKRRPSPMTDAILELLADPAHHAGLGAAQIADLTGVSEKNVNALKRKGVIFKSDGWPPRYFLTAEAAAAAPAVRKAPLRQKPEKLELPRLAKTERPRQHVKKDIAPKACLSPSTPKLTNPVRGRHSQGLARPMSAAEPHNPNNVQPTICPGYRAPHERWADEGGFGAGFAAVGIGRSPLTGKAWE